MNLMDERRGFYLYAPPLTAAEWSESPLASTFITAIHVSSLNEVGFRINRGRCLSLARSPFGILALNGKNQMLAIHRKRGEDDDESQSAQDNDTPFFVCGGGQCRIQKLDVIMESWFENEVLMRYLEEVGRFHEMT